MLPGILGNAQLLLDAGDPERRHTLGVIAQAALDGAAPIVKPFSAARITSLVSKRIGARAV